MKIYSYFAILACMSCASLLAGCSVTGAIKPAATSSSEFEGAVYSGKTTVINKPTPDVEAFRVFNQGATSFVSLEANREDARNRANEFCASQEKRFRILQETLSTPPHILGNFPRVEILFECVTPVVNESVESKYRKLMDLKQLLDSGALTQEEYDLEKMKILRR